MKKNEYSNYICNFLINILCFRVTKYKSLWGGKQQKARPLFLFHHNTHNNGPISIKNSQLRKSIIIL